MSGSQISLVQIDNYGPWTVSPAPRAEPDIQTLQSRLYADLSQFINAHGGYLFYSRFDNMVAVTNGMEEAAFDRMQESIRNRYPVTISVSTARDPSPAVALSRATAELQAAGSAQDGSRREICRFVDGPSTSWREGDVTIAHFDVVNATGTYTDLLSAYDTWLEIAEGNVVLMRYLYSEYEGLSFFVGGDNIISVCPDLPASAYNDAITYVTNHGDLELQVGVGTGATARQAGRAAKHALETCRHEQTRVTLDSPATQTRE